MLPNKPSFTSKIIELGFLALGLLAFIAITSGCTKDPHTEPNVDWIQNMMEMPSIKAQELGPYSNMKEGELFARIGMRPAPAGTIPRNYYPYAYAKTDEGAAQASHQTNPLPRSMAVMKRGQVMFNTYCIVCHGSRAEGDGPITGKFPRPPSLHTDKVRGWTDGRIFHTITVGQNIMPSYTSQVSREDRWAIIHYVRALQRANNPMPNDLKELQAAAPQGESK